MFKYQELKYIKKNSNKTCIRTPNKEGMVKCREECSSASVQLLSHVWLFVTPWTAAGQASLSITNSGSLLKLLSIELVMPPNHLILCLPLLLLPSIFPSIRVSSNESVLRIMAKVLELQLQHQSFQWIFRTDFWLLLLSGLSCPTLCDPIDGSPPGSPIPGILQARTLEWVAISFSNAWKWKVKSGKIKNTGRHQIYGT